MDEQWGPQLAEDGNGIGGAPVRVGRDTDVEGLSRGDRSVKGAKRLLERGFGVEVVVVEDVDVVESEPPEALVEACDQVLSRSEIAVGARPHVPTSLGGDDEFIAVVLEVVVEDPCEVFLSAAVGGPVIVG